LSKYIHIYAGKKDEEKKKKQIVAVLQGAPPLPEGKKGGHAALMTEKMVFPQARFSSLSPGLAFS